MKQEDKHCTRDQGKTFNNYGIHIIPQWIWDQPYKGSGYIVIESVRVSGNRSELIPAFDVPEIMSILPTEIETNKGTAVLWINRTYEREYEAGYVFKDWKFTVEFSTGEHLAHTLMDLLLWTIDNGYLKKEDIKL